MGRTLSLFGQSFLLNVQEVRCYVGLERVLISKGTSFSPTNNELLEHLKEKMDQTNSLSYPFILTLLFQCLC
jgi:hypothetical protein